MKAENALVMLRDKGVGLAQSYPYAFILGKYLRKSRLDWWQMFRDQEIYLASLPLPQARDYAFLEFCEEKFSLSEVDSLLAKFIDSEDGFLLQELINTAHWYVRF